MTTEYWTILLFLCLFSLIFLGLPVCFALGGTAMVFIAILWGPDALYLAVSQPWAAGNQFILVAIPLFVFMAMILERSGIADELYDMMYIWFGGIRGGLAVGTLIICTIFAAMCGISGTATVTMGAIALPSMLKRGYNRDIAIGCINSGGGWGILMPPSVDMIIYALISGESVGRMFAGGIIPTLLLLTLDSIYIFVRSFIQKDLAPALSKDERVSFVNKIRTLKSVILPIIVTLGVLGSILLGIASPTEAASIGVLASILVAWKRLNIKLIYEAAGSAFRISAMIMWLIFGAYCLSSIIQGMNVSNVVHNLVQYIPAGRWGVIIFFQIIIFFFAMAMSSTGIMLITLPIMLPIVESLGFDTLWFGILFIVQMEIGYMTPPFGYNLFYLKAVAPNGISMGDIYKSAIFFIMVETIGLIVLMIFPQLALWLPNLLFPK